MRVEKGPIEGLAIVTLDRLGDSRGFFVERYHERKFRELGLPTQFAQDNHSRSGPRVLRGLHFQHTPAQGKLIGVVAGRVWDVAVDIRPGSSTFGKCFGLELSEERAALFWIPAGFAHGFCVLGDEPADMLYKCTELYEPSGEGGLRWNDPDLSVPWPIRDPLVSTRDAGLPSFSQYRANPPEWRPKWK